MIPYKNYNFKKERKKERISNMKNKLFCAVVLLLIGCMPLIAKKTTIKFAMGTNVANSELTQKLLKKFEKKNPEIKVDVVRISTSSTDNYAYIL